MADSKLIDLKNFPVSLVLKDLIKDKTTKMNIIFATSSYSEEYPEIIIKFEKENDWQKYIDSNATVKVRYYDAGEDIDEAYKDVLGWCGKQKVSTKGISYAKWGQYFLKNYKVAYKEYKNDLSDFDPEEYDPEEDGTFEEFKANFYEEVADGYFDTITVKIPLEKQGKKWLISKHNKQLKTIMDSGVAKQIHYIQKHPKEYIKYLWGYED